MARLEGEAEENAARLREEREAKEKERGHKLGGVPPKALDGIPEDKAQSNFTNPESRILKTKNGYEQAYNCQAAVDSENQVIVARGVTNRTQRPLAVPRHLGPGAMARLMSFIASSSSTQIVRSRLAVTPTNC